MGIFFEITIAHTAGKIKKEEKESKKRRDLRLEIAA